MFVMQFEDLPDELVVQDVTVDMVKQVLNDVREVVNHAGAQEFVGRRYEDEHIILIQTPHQTTVTLKQQDGGGAEATEVFDLYVGFKKQWTLAVMRKGGWMAYVHHLAEAALEAERHLDAMAEKMVELSFAPVAGDEDLATIRRGIVAQKGNPINDLRRELWDLREHIDDRLKQLAQRL